MSGAATFEGIMNTMAENEQADDTRRDSAITNRAEGIRSVMDSQSRDRQNQTGRDDSNAVAAARMNGTSPLQHQSQRAQMLAAGEFLGGGGRSPLSGPASQTGLRGGLTKHMPSGGTRSAPLSASALAAFSPGALAAAEANWWNQQNIIDPRSKGPDLGAVGYGPAGTQISSDLETARTGRLAEREAEDEAYITEANAQRAALMAALNELGPDSGKEEASGKDGGSNWKKWGLTAAGLGAAYLGGRYAS